MLQTQRTVEDFGFNLKIAEYFMRCAEPYLQNPVLDVGCGVGVITKYVSDCGFEVYGVDGNPEKIALAKKRVPQAKFTCAYLEKFQPKQRFSTVIVKNVLEHFSESDVPSKMSHVKNWLAKDGYLIVYVPIKTSLHKRVWFDLGFDKVLGELTQADFEVGHQQVYTKNSLFTQLEQAGYKVVFHRGLVLKPYPNEVMTELSNRYCECLFEVAEDRSLVDYCSGIFCVSKLNTLP